MSNEKRPARGRSSGSDYRLGGRATIHGAIAAVFRSVAAVVSAERGRTTPASANRTAPAGAAATATSVVSACLATAVRGTRWRANPTTRTGTNGRSPGANKPQGRGHSIIDEVVEVVILPVAGFRLGAHEVSLATCIVSQHFCFGTRVNSSIDSILAGFADRIYPKRYPAGVYVLQGTNGHRHRATPWIVQLHTRGRGTSVLHVKPAGKYDKG